MCPFTTRLAKHIPMAALKAGFRLERVANADKEIELTAALPAQKSLNVIARIPEVK